MHDRALILLHLRGWRWKKSVAGFCGAAVTSPYAASEAVHLHYSTSTYSQASADRRLARHDVRCGWLVEDCDDVVESR